jgi:hypothetical protein
MPRETRGNKPGVMALSAQALRKFGNFQRNMSMKKLVLAVAVAASLPLFGTPAQAQQYPWCAIYSGGRGGGGINCGFVSFAQCQTSIRGVGGTCQVNPAYSVTSRRARRHG